MEFSWFNLFLVVLISWLTGALVLRLGYPHVLGELAAGIIFGPPLLGIVHGDAGIALLGKLGILMMVLFIGSRVDPFELAKSAKAAALPTIGGFFVPFVLGFVAATFMGIDTNAALVVGTVMGTTALVTTSRLVTDLGLLKTRLGQTLMAVALMSVVVVLVAFSATLGIVDSKTIQLGPIALVLGKAMLFLVLVTALGLYGFPLLGRLHERIERHPGATDELTVAILFATAVAALAELFGMSFILGAFFAGLFLREDMFEDGTFANIIAGVRDVSLGFLAPIFYVSAGFSVSFGVLKDNPTFVLTVVVVALAAKFLGGMVFYLFTGRGWREALVVGAGLNARGSIDIIVAGVGLQMKVITPQIYTSLILMIFIANLIVPVALKKGSDWLRQRGELLGADEPPTAPAKIPAEAAPVASPASA